MNRRNPTITLAVLLMMLSTMFVFSRAAKSKAAQFQNGEPAPVPQSTNGGQSFPVQLMRPLPLPDDGRGSNVQSVYEREQEAEVFGSKVTVSGRTVPMIWSYEFQTTGIVSNQLPLPYSSEGEAIGGGVFTNGDMVAVGNVWQGDLWWGVLWRKPANGTWSMPQLLCQDATESYVSATDTEVTDYQEGGISQVVVGVAGSALEDGRWQPVLHRVTTDSVETIDVPLPPSWNGAKVNIDIGHTLAEPTAGAGWIAGPDGRRRPVTWMESSPNQFTLNPIPVPNNVSGAANAILVDNATAIPDVRVVGELIQNGRTRGFFSNPGGGLLGLRPLEGFSNSSAHDLGRLAVTHGTETNVFGVSSNLSKDLVGTVWLSSGNPNDRDFSPVGAQQFLVDPSVGVVTSFRPTNENSNDIAVGQIVSTPGAPPRACLFLATDVHVPDIVEINSGGILAGLGDGSVKLWHDDDDELVIRAVQVGGARRASVELAYRGLVDNNSNSAVQTINARVGSPRGVAGGVINFYAYNWTNQQWQIINSFSVSEDGQQLSQILTDDLLNGLGVFSTGEFRLRLEFISNGPGPAELIIDAAGWDTETLNI